MPPDGKINIFYCFKTFLIIFIIELPFSLNKTRIGNRMRIRIRAYDVRIRIQEAKNTDLAPFILYWYFIPFSSGTGTAHIKLQ
jgi:hypothetical protein